MINPPRKSKSIELSDSVADVIEQLFAVQTIRRLAPANQLHKIRSREIRVWPMTRRGEVDTRAADACEYTVAVAILERIPDDDDEDLLADELIAFAESIGENLNRRNFGPAGRVATAIAYEHAPLFDKELLESHRLLAAGVALTLTRHEKLPSPTE